MAETLWEHRREAESPGSFWGMMAIAFSPSATQAGGPKTPSLPGAGIWPLWLVHMVTMGLILRTLDNTVTAEKGRILVGHKSTQCSNLDGAHVGQRIAFMPSSVLPGGHCLWRLFHADSQKPEQKPSSGLSGVGKPPVPSRPWLTHSPSLSPSCLALGRLTEA